MLGPKEINNHPPPLETGDPPTDEQAESDESADSPEGNEPNESNDSSESGESAEDTTQDERTDQVQADEAEDELITAVAPTCGPCCHGADDEMCRPQEGPPPLETPKGCAVGGEPAEDPQQALMLLGLGALGLRRRRRDRRS